MNPFVQMGFETVPPGMIMCATHGLASENDGACAMCLDEANDPQFIQCADHGSQKKNAAGVCPFCEALGRRAPVSALPTPDEVAAAVSQMGDDHGSPIGTAAFQSDKVAPPPAPANEKKWAPPPGVPNRGAKP
jgi:hypothetical protein